MSGKGSWDERSVHLVAHAVAEDMGKLSQLAGERPAP